MTNRVKKKIDETSEDLLRRMHGATISRDPGATTAFVKSHKISAVRHVHLAKGKADEEFIEIALSPARGYLNQPLIAVKIDQRNFAQLRRLMDSLERK